MRSGLSVRSARASDIPVIVSLQQQSETAAQWSAQEYERMLCEERSILMVAESEGAVCGFLAGSRTGPEWELDNIAVESRMRRKGAGRILLQRFLEQAKLADAQKIFLQVREDNLAARELYEGAGFRITGKRSGYYRGEDAVLYGFEFTRRS